MCYAVSMRKAKVNSAQAQRIITAALSGQLDEAQALELYQLGPEMVQLALLATVIGHPQRYSGADRKCCASD